MDKYFDFTSKTQAEFNEIINNKFSEVAVYKYGKHNEMIYILLDKKANPESIFNLLELTQTVEKFNNPVTEDK